MTFLEIIFLILLCVFLALLCYLVVKLVEEGPLRRMEPETKPSRAEPIRDTFGRMDRLFDIGALLVTVLAAAEIQYASVRRLSEIDFAFKVLTIPIIILIILWLIKDLIRHLYWRIYVRSFCWSFFGYVLSLDILIFVILSFPMTGVQLVSFALIDVVLSYLLSIWIIFEYIKGSQIRLIGHLERAAFSVPLFIISILAYYTLLWIVQLSNLA